MMQKLLLKSKDWSKKSWHFLNHENLIRPLSIILIIIVIISPLIILFESNYDVEINKIQDLADSSNISKIEDGIWWTIVTLTTVGYGDFYPKTLPGRLIALFVMTVGIVALAALNASLASILVQKKNERGLGNGFL